MSFQNGGQVVCEKTEVARNRPAAKRKDFSMVERYATHRYNFLSPLQKSTFQQLFQNVLFRRPANGNLVFADADVIAFDRIDL